MKNYVLFDIATKTVLSVSADMEPEAATQLNRQYRAENSSKRWIMNTDSMQAFLAALAGKQTTVYEMPAPDTSDYLLHLCRKRREPLRSVGVILQWPERMAR